MSSGMRTSSGQDTQPYEQFFKNTEAHGGYDFHQGPPTSVAPPLAAFSTPLRWWTLDRPKRLKVIRRLRDQYLQDILQDGEFDKRYRRSMEKETNATTRPLDRSPSTSRRASNPLTHSACAGC